MEGALKCLTAEDLTACAEISVPRGRPVITGRGMTADAAQQLKKNVDAEMMTCLILFR